MTYPVKDFTRNYKAISVQDVGVFIIEYPIEGLTDKYNLYVVPSPNEQWIWEGVFDSSESAIAYISEFYDR